MADGSGFGAPAEASDGDLVVHYAEMGEKLQLSRFDRQGHRKLFVPSPLGGTFGQDAQLAGMAASCAQR
jgi:hypothetical protein